MRRTMQVTALTVLLLASACASTQLTQVWKEPSSAPVRKVLVLAIVPQEGQRRGFEQRIVEDLAKRGVTAVPSYQYLPDKKSMTREAVHNIAQQQGFDGVLVSRLVGVDQQQTYVPGTFDGYYDLWGPGFYSPGYYETTTRVRMQTDLFAVQAGQPGALIWSASSSTFNPSSTEGAVNGIASKVIGRLHKDGLV